MKKVFAFHLPKNKNFHGYYMDSLHPYSFFNEDPHFTWREFLSGGINKWDKKRNFGFIHEIDTLYRYKDKGYMQYIEEFLDKYKDFDMFIMSSFNPIHPEIISKYLKNKTKILGFIDDPYSSYTRGMPNLWAFDGAFYISPSYSSDKLFEEALLQWGSSNNKWYPLSPKTISYPEISNNFFKNRSLDLVYVGNFISYPDGSKADRLIKLKNHFKDKFQIHGRWGFKGYSAAIRFFCGKPFFLNRVTGISMKERQDLYFNTKIGLNMHVSPTPTETGNMRMYEIPQHGMMQICDKAGMNAHEQIFSKDECIYYDNTDEAIDLIEYYLTHDEERIKIAKAGFEITKKDYVWEKNMKELLDWAWNLKH